MNDNQRLIAKILELKSSNSTTRFEVFIFIFIFIFKLIVITGEGRLESLMSPLIVISNYNTVSFQIKQPNSK